MSINALNKLRECIGRLFGYINIYVFVDIVVILKGVPISAKLLRQISSLKQLIESEMNNMYQLPCCLKNIVDFFLFLL